VAPLRARSPARIVVAIVGLLAVITPVYHAAAQTAECKACVTASGCESHHSECVAECRARLFSIDPRRANCISTCTDAAAGCTRSITETCRAQHHCP
jgi:hypothetical protein